MERFQVLWSVRDEGYSREMQSDTASMHIISPQSYPRCVIRGLEGLMTTPLLVLVGSDLPIRSYRDAFNGRH